MLKKILFIFLGEFLTFQSVYADMYSIHNVHVDMTAQNATEAREQGLNEAQEKAFYKMLDRLTLLKDMESLPVLTNEDILNLVQDFSVSNEKTSSVRYIADVDVQFNPEAIQTFFQEYQVPYVTSVSEKFVVFPVYRDSVNSEPLLWKDTNIWARFLSGASETSDLVPFAVPLGDLDDMSIVNETNIQDENSLDITPILNRYNASNALLIELTMLKEENALKVFIRPFQNKKGFITEIGLTEPINAPMPEVFKRVAERTVYSLEQAWREKNAVRFDNPTKISVRIDIKNLGEWIAIRKRLDKVVLIKKYIVNTVRKDQAKIEVFYAGEIGPFKDSLKKEELFLSKIDEDSWLLRDLKDVSEEELNALEKEEETTAFDEENDDKNSKEDEISVDVSQEQGEIQTFDPVLYQSIETQPETLQMLDEMKKETLSEQE